ncbi:MAG: EamA family transporter [Clostridia bacterium]|nr:EamA family transporter [Clostridia bacterium]
MGYLFLLVALLAGVTKGYCGKRTSGYTNTFNDALFANSIRMGLCVIIGFILVTVTGDLSSIVPNAKMLLISALSGVSMAIFVVTWLILVKKSAYMLLDIFLMLGVLVPLIAGKIFFDEDIKTTQWIGIGVLFVAVLFMYSHNNSIKEKVSVLSLILLIVCGVANGVADFSQKVFMKTLPNGSPAVFNLYTYVFAGIVLIIAFAFTYKKENGASKSDIKKMFWFILVMAICLFANSYFKTLSAGYLSAILLYPLNNGGALILSTVMSATLFKEKLTVKAILGIVIAFIGLLIINLL